MTARTASEVHAPLIDPNKQYIARSAPAPARKRYLDILEPGTVVKAPGISGWSFHLARVENDPGPLENPARQVSIAKAYFGADGNEISEGNPDRITIRRDRMDVWPRA